MTSKEAMAKLKENFENDVYKVEREMLNVVDKDLVISEILKEYVYLDKKDNLIKMRAIEKRWENFDFEILKSSQNELEKYVYQKEDSIKRLQIFMRLASITTPEHRLQDCFFLKYGNEIWKEMTS